GGATMSRLTHVFAFSVALVGTSVAQAQNGEVGSALKYVPASANSLAIVKVQDLMNSPRGIKEEWAQKHQTAFLAGSVHVPPALDFQDLVDPKQWRERIKSSPAVVGKPNAVKLLSELGDSMRGVSLKINVTDKTIATITLDFGTPVSQTALPFIQPLLVDLLD